MSEETATVTVDVPTETPDDETIVNVDEGDTVVVLETPEETTEETSLALIVGQLVARVDELAARVDEAQGTADVALEVADVAVTESVAAEEIAEDVGDSVVVVADAVANDDPEELQETAEEIPDTDDSILPTKKHFVHRSFHELLGR